VTRIYSGGADGGAAAALAPPLHCPSFVPLESRVMHEIRHVAYRYGIGLPLVLLCCGAPASAHSVPQDFSVQLERTHCSPAQA
jgi:hypothetical protein